MEVCWENFPKELLSDIFKHLGRAYIKTEMIRWMTSKDIKYMIGSTPFEHFVRDRNITGCMMSISLFPKQKINWTRVSQYPLSESFIDLYHNHLNWYWISCKQRLSERLMDVYPDKLDWWNVSLYQRMLSEEFKLRHRDKIIKRLLRD